MKSINRQLNIGVTPMNTNIVPSRYARSANNYQVQLGTEDPSLDFYNDSQALESMSNANGWQSDSESIDYDERLDYMEEYYNAFGGFLGLGYPACIKSQCKECKSECKNTQGLKWRKGGKGCYQSCRTKLQTEQNANIASMSSKTSITAPPPIDTTQTAGMSMGAKIGMAVGGVVILGLVIYLIKKK
tara:strand:+ start:19904 stop:20464 length:561 start_codon:yes stop_codon:yes gene_type:complete